MKRREFVLLLGGAATWALAARAQQPDRIRRIGLLMGWTEGDRQASPGLAAFTGGLRSDLDRMRTFAKELVELQPDIVVGHTTQAVAALQQETRTIPIVFVAVSDPVGSGFVASLARPGGNITGFINIEASLGSKWVGGNLTGFSLEVTPRNERQNDTSYWTDPHACAARGPRGPGLDLRQGGQTNRAERTLTAAARLLRRWRPRQRQRRLRDRYPIPGNAWCLRQRTQRGLKSTKSRQVR
jgi:ABC transporter substrate binding protein